MEYKRKLVRIALSVILATICAVIVNTYYRERTFSADDMTTYQESIAEKILRFHVLAHSDSSEDQELKLKVKDAVVNYLAPYMAESENLMLTEEIVESHKEDIISVAREVVYENGYTYSISTEIADEYYPLKTYGDVMLPPGTYHSFIITIGDGIGGNWWCILYPPLCFVDATCGVVPDSSKSQLENILSEDEYMVITTGVPKDITIKLKIVELYEKIFK